MANPAELLLHTFTRWNSSAADARGARGWLCQVDLAPVGRFHSAPPEWGPEPLESGVWMGGRGCAVWLRRLVGIASRCVRMPSS